MSVLKASVDSLAKFRGGSLEGFRKTNGAEQTEITDATFDTADVGTVEIGAFGEFFLREILCIAARTDIVSEFSEGGGGWHPQTLTECGLSDHGL